MSIPDYPPQFPHLFSDSTCVHGYHNCDNCATLGHMRAHAVREHYAQERAEALVDRWNEAPWNFQADECAAELREAIQGGMTDDRRILEAVRPDLAAWRV